MIKGANVTIYISNMDRSVSFYTETLGLNLLNRYGDHFAMVRAPDGFTIGLHPASDRLPAGKVGSMGIGLSLEGSIQDAVATLGGRGVTFTSPIINDKGGSFIGFDDPDGTPLYLWQDK